MTMSSAEHVDAILSSFLFLSRGGREGMRTIVKLNIMNRLKMLFFFYLISPSLNSAKHFVASENEKSSWDQWWTYDDILDSSQMVNVTISGSESGQVTSVNYPHLYLNHLDYFVKIVPGFNNSHSTSHDHKWIVVWFELVDIEYQDSCLYDYLEIRSIRRDSINSKHNTSTESEGGHHSGNYGPDFDDRSAVNNETSDSHRICGKMYDSRELLKHTYFGNANEVDLRFHSDYSVRGNGFLLKWQSLDTSICGSEMKLKPVDAKVPSTFSESATKTPNSSFSSKEVTATKGTISSPGYPDWLVPSLNCSVHLSAPQGFRILVTVIDLDLGNSEETSSAFPFSFSTSKFNNCSPGNRFMTSPATIPAPNSTTALGYNASHQSFVAQNHLNLNLAGGHNSLEERIITLCGSVDDNDYFRGQSFLTYGSELRLQLITKARSFGQLYEKFRGYQFQYELLASPELLNKPMTVTSLIRVQVPSFGRVTSLNFPHPPPEKVAQKVFLRSEIGSRIELRVPRSMARMLIQGVCDQRDTTLIVIGDYFGNISLYPPIPNIWSICSGKGGHKSPVHNNFHGTQLQKGGKKPGNVIQSNFHVISIKTSELSSLPSLVLYKAIQDENFISKSSILPSRYLQESCASEPCSLDHGKCISKVIRNVTINYCKCSQHWTGIFCHMTLCQNNPCKNDGVCQLHATENTFECQCNNGFGGKTCTDTIEKCDRFNPCRDRGKCQLINGEPSCTCHPWFVGKFCEQFRFKGQYKPLSQRMLEEPFWLGLIAIGSVLILISFVYCIRQMFAEKIEQFFADEIEKAKYMPYNFTEVGSGPRYSVTSNIGLNVNVHTPIRGDRDGGGTSPLPRSRSSIIGKLRKKGLKKGRGGHLSDSEVCRFDGRHMDVDSDAESIPTPASRRFPSFFLGKRGSSGCSINNINGSSSNRGSSIELKAQPDSSEKPPLSPLQPSGRRMSFDDFLKATEAKIRRRKYLEIEGYNVKDMEKSRSPGSVSETSFCNTATPGDRVIPTIAEFHVITENSLEEVESNDSRCPSSPRMFGQRINERDQSLSIDKSPVFKQESEIEGILTDIRSIQRAAALDVSTTSHSEDSDQHARGQAAGVSVTRANSPRPRLSRPPSGFSSSSSDSRDAQPAIPSITVTEACIEYDDSMYTMDPDEMNEAVDQYQENCEEGLHTKEALFAQESAASSLQKKMLDSSMRRASVPNPGIKNNEGEVMGLGRMGTRATLATTRKYSLDVEKPKITITTDYDAQIHQSSKCTRRKTSAGQCSTGHSIRTVSESNISTSGYSSLSSPGISRCSSSSPITDFTFGFHSIDHIPQPCTNSTTHEAPGDGTMGVVISATGPASPNAVTSSRSKHKSTFGNFLTIPTLSYSLVPHHGHRQQPASPTLKQGNDAQQFLYHCPGSPVSSRQRGLSKGYSRDEGIDISSDTGSSKNYSQSGISANRRERLVYGQRYSLESTAEETSNIDRRKKIIHNSKSFDCFFPHQSLSGETLPVPGSATVSRQPSWPGSLHPPPEGSPSSDSDADTIREQEQERKLMLLKRQERRSRSGSNQSLNKDAPQSRREMFQSRSKSPLAKFSRSTDASYMDDGAHSFDGTCVRPEFVRCNSARSLIMSRSLCLDDETSSESSESLVSSLDDQSSELNTIRTARSMNTINFPPSRPSSTTTTTSESGRDSGNMFIRRSPSERILFQMRATSQSLPNEASSSQHSDSCSSPSSHKQAGTSSSRHHQSRYSEYYSHSQTKVVNCNSWDDVSRSSLASTHQSPQRQKSTGHMVLPKGLKRLLRKEASCESLVTRSTSVSPSFRSSHQASSPSPGEESMSLLPSTSPTSPSLSPPNTRARRASLVRQKASIEYGALH